MRTLRRGTQRSLFGSRGSPGPSSTIEPARTGTVIVDRNAKICQAVKLALLYLITASPKDIRKTEPTIRATPRTGCAGRISPASILATVRRPQRRYAANVCYQQIPLPRNDSDNSDLQFI